MQAVEFHAMGCPCKVQAQTQAACDAARRIVDDLEARYSRYRPDSLLSAANRSAGAPQGWKADPETARLLDFAQAAYEQSEGGFDITAGVLRRVWDFRSGRLPTPDAVRACLGDVGWSRVGWDGDTLRLPAGMELDFGGFVKEYAADAAAAAARAAGARHGLVDLGGDLAVIGPDDRGAPWQVGIRDPLGSTQPVARIALGQGGLASSGMYERCIRVGDRVYGHVLDPRTGWPPEEGLAAVSVQAESCLIAGIAATVALVQGAQAGQRWLDQLGLPYVTVDRSGRRRFGPASASDQGAGAAGPINGSESVPSTLT